MSNSAEVYELQDGKAIPTEADECQHCETLSARIAELEVELASNEAMEKKKLRIEINSLRQSNALLNKHVGYMVHAFAEVLVKMTLKEKSSDDRVTPDMVQAVRDLLCCMKLAGWESDTSAVNARNIFKKHLEKL